MATIKQKLQSSPLVSLRGLSVIAIIAVFAAASLYVPYARADQYTDQINQISNDNSQKQSVQSQLGAEAGNLSDTIGKLQAEINALQAKINENQTKMVQLQAQIKAAEAELAKQKDLLGQTIRAMYVEGDISTVEMLATSKDLSDFFDKQQYRESVRSKIKTTLDKITKLKLDLSTQKDTVEKLLNEQTVLQGQLGSQKAENDRLLSLNKQQQSDLDTQIKANNAKINQLRAEQAAAYASYSRRGGVTLYGESGNGGYPSVWANALQDSMIDDWGMYNRECVSYVAWKVASSGRFMPYGYGNAADWAWRAQRDRYTVDNHPTVGSVAQWGSEDGLGSLGHVAYVELANGDGSIEVSQYNFVHGRFNRMHVPASDVSHLSFIHF